MITLDSLTLPEALVWSDELAWTPVAATQVRTIGGKLLVHESAHADNAGRPVTLTAEDGWLPRADLITLAAWAAEPGKAMLLTLHDGRVLTVRFRHWEEPVLTAQPVVEALADPTADDLYALTELKLAVL